MATGAMMAVVHRPDGWDLRLWVNPVFDGHGSVVQIGIESGQADFDADAMANAMATLEQLGGRA